MKKFFCIISMTFTCLVGGVAWAIPVQWTGPGANNHWYEAVYMPGNITWTAAKAATEARGGYLATATSVEENSFIFSLINDLKFWINYDPWKASLGPLIGGYYVGPPGTMNPDNWAWTSGEPWEYKNWAAGEPNLNDETALHFAAPGLNNMQPTWNNLRDSTGMKGYVIEWNNFPGGNILPILLFLD